MICFHQASVVVIQPMMYFYMLKLAFTCEYVSAVLLDI